MFSPTARIGVPIVYYLDQPGSGPNCRGKTRAHRQQGFWNTGRGRVSSILLSGSAGERVLVGSTKIDLRNGAQLVARRPRRPSTGGVDLAHFDRRPRESGGTANPADLAVLLLFV